MKKNKIESNTSIEAMKVAKATQKPGQTKEQTKLISQGIEKGIAEYKKQQKAKSRERDKARKAQLKQRSTVVVDEPLNEKTASNTIYIVGLVLSWVLFISYAIFVNTL